MNSQTRNVRANARMLAEVLDIAELANITVLYAHVAEGHHLVTVETLEEGHHLAKRLGAYQETRFGWNVPGTPGRPTIIELHNRPKIHPRG